MSENSKRLEELFRSFSNDKLKLDYNNIRGVGVKIEVADEHFDAKELDPKPEFVPIYIPPELSVPMPQLDAARFLKEAGKQLLNDEKRKNFLNRYSAMYADAPLPLTMRLVYDDFASWDFQSGDRVNFVFELMACSRRILEVFEITEKPETIELQVWRPPYRHPKDESRIHPASRDPRNGSWISVMQFKVQEVTPFFSFEELELAHMEMWEQMRDYARRSMNPCGELPLVEQNLGIFLPKQ